MATILCVDDEPAVLLILRTALDQAGHRCIAVNNVNAAFNVLARGPVDLIIADFRMPDATGLDFLGRLAARGIDVPLVMATGHGGAEQAIAALRAGAVDTIAKPVRSDLLAFVVDRALELASLRRENGALRSELRQLRGAHHLIGESPVFQRLLELVRTVAPTRAPILVLGESGTGKELIARTVHELSDRADAPFVAVSCAALPQPLVESTLFGNDHGAGAGGRGRVRGALERARRGTLLLDEISELRADLQTRLLHLLEEGDRNGGDPAGHADVRIVATSSRDLADDARQGRFREDLFYRLTVVPVRVPPLRERPEDILLLARHFAARVAREMGKEFTGFDADALARLQAYSWPGNVRELAHAVERAIILSPGPTLAASAFAFPGPAATGPATQRAPGESAEIIGLRSLSIAEAEAALIERALVVTRNNRTRAAELLGISVRTLRNKLNRDQPTAAD